MVAALNNLDILDADMEKTYLNATISECIWTVCGVKFGSHKVKKALII
jgi:hypothetical protein